MPHYADGTLAQIGDKVKGKPYNTPHEVVGEIVDIISISGQETCNCVVAFLSIFDLKDLIEKGLPRYPAALMPVKGSDGVDRGLVPVTDYGETRAFTKIL